MGRLTAARAVLLLILLIFLGTACNRPNSPAPVTADAPAESVVVDAEIAAAVDEVLQSSRLPWLRWPELTDVSEALATLYESEKDRLLWFDVALSVGVLRMMEAVHIGRPDPRTLGWGFDVNPKKLDRPSVLRNALNGEGVPTLLDGLEPAFPHYRRNRAALANYRSLAEAGEPDPVPDLPDGHTKIEPGDAWRGVTALRLRLIRFRDLEPSAPIAFSGEGKLLYDGPVVDAVRRFQTRHILDADGIIGKQTIEALNVPLATRVRQIELAMERGRWLPSLDDQPARPAGLDAREDPSRHARRSSEARQRPRASHRRALLRYGPRQLGRHRALCR